MNSNITRKLIFSLFFLSFVSNAQIIKTDSIKEIKKFNYKTLIIPSTLIGYGLIGLENDGLKDFNLSIKECLNKNINKKTSIDDFSQYLPAATVYSLNAMGIKGKNNFKDRTIILATSYLLVTAVAIPLKSITKVERPDGSALNSFPSGHTATAFASAEFLWQEYKDVSIWYGVSGYLVATGTGFLRMSNNKHWLTDVAAGAGIGIICTKTAYWINPLIQKTFFKKKQANTAAMVAPFYNGNQFGLGFVTVF